MREEVAAPAKGVIGLAEGPQGTPLIIQAAQSRGCVRAHTALFRAALATTGPIPRGTGTPGTRSIIAFWAESTIVPRARGHDESVPPRSRDSWAWRMRLVRWQFLFPESGVEADHQKAGLGIVDAPEAGDDVPDASLVEGAACSPITPSPSKSGPRPVSHADSTASSQPEQSSPATSSAVVIPVPQSIIPGWNSMEPRLIPHRPRSTPRAGRGRAAPHIGPAKGQG